MPLTGPPSTVAVDNLFAELRGDSPIKVDQQEAKRLERSLAKMERPGENTGVVRGVRAAQREVYQAALRRVPLHTGALASSLYRGRAWTTKNGRVTQAAVYAGYGLRDGRATFAEYGTHSRNRTVAYGRFKRGPQAYIAPALARVSPKLLPLMGAEVRQYLREFGR